MNLFVHILTAGTAPVAPTSGVIEQFQSYGPHGFAIAAVIVLWKLIVQPSQKAIEKVVEENAATAQSLQVTTLALKDAATALQQTHSSMNQHLRLQEALVNQTERVIKRLERLHDCKIDAAEDVHAGG